MTWISLVCLLALSSSAFSRSVVIPTLGGGYGGAAFPLGPKIITPMREFLPRPIVTTGYGAPQTEVITPVVTAESALPKVFNSYDTTVTKVFPTGGYGGGMSRVFLDQTPTTTVVGPSTTVAGPGPAVVGPGPAVVTPVIPVTQADLLCRGQLPETVIPLDGGQRFVVCLDESKGVEQFCPKGLIYVETLRRCERRTGPFDACASQPCLGGGACLNTEYSYQCQCQPGFDGKNCELDARICQTQQPCGSGPDARCQSFRWGAALEYICVFQDGDAYGLSPAQIHTSPCQGIDGPHALAFTNKGFIMCDGERTFFESCPGGTIWDDFNKACVWPDMFFEVAGYGQHTLIGKTGYGGPLVVDQPKHLIGTKVFEQGRPVISSYGGDVVGPRVLEPVRPVVSSYGGDGVLPSRIIEPVRPFGSSYGGETVVTKVMEPMRPVVSSYGGEVVGPRVFEQGRPVVSSYGGEVVGPRVFEQGRPVVSSYGGDVVLPSKVIEPVRPFVSSYGGEVVGPRVFEQGRPFVSSYGGATVVPRAHFEQPRVISSYGGPREEVVVKAPY